eukprot:6032090-Pleurochrysis_carterae.AAC.4
MQPHDAGPTCRAKFGRETVRCAHGRGSWRAKRRGAFDAYNCGGFDSKSDTGAKSLTLERHQLSLVAKERQAVHFRLLVDKNEEQMC